MIKRAIYFFAVYLGIVALTFGQQDEELAAQFYISGEYQKAAVLYEKLLKQQPQSPYFYDNLFNSYIALKDYDEARSVAKTQSRRFKNNFYYKVDVGYAYKLEGQKKDAEKIYRGLIEDLSPSYETSLELFNAFLKRDELENGMETIQKSRKEIKDKVFMAEEMATIYDKLGKQEDMMEEYLNLLESDIEKEKTVKDGLISRITSDEGWSLLKKKLGMRVQKEPNKEEYSDLLRWLLVQKKEWEAALIQYRAAEKRLKMDGRIMRDFADLAKDNEAYETAREAYAYIVSLGNEKPFYAQAKFGLANISYKLIRDDINPPLEACQAAEREYVSLLEEFGENYRTAPSMMELADIYLKYLHQARKAIDIYERIMQLPGTSKELLGYAKLYAGDAYLVLGEIWDAQLLYSQVDKDYKEEPLGQEAKLRNARLSYFKGEFEFAQAQLDVLKTATSQLISNNAIELSLLIQENAEGEDFDSGLFMYSTAELYMMQNLNARAIEVLDSIKILFPTHALNDEILLLKARLMRQTGNYQEAEQYYKKVFDEYMWDILSDNAMFELADLYEKKLNRPEEAKKLYERIILEKEGSLYITEARARYRRLRGEKPDTPPPGTDLQHDF